MSELREMLGDIEAIIDGDDRLSVLVPKHCPHAVRKSPDLDRDPSRVPKNLRESFKACAAGELPWPLLVHGDVGTGKSRFGLIINDYYSGRLMDFADLLAEYTALRRGELHANDSTIVLILNERNVRETEWISALAEPRVFVVDDIARKGDTQSETSRELLSRLLDRREGKPTILISNLGPVELSEAYDDRVASRMCAGTIVCVAGDDRRIR